ncbi:hypothetical protein DN752_21520 [Echinicola strongylocentroti]|uniref:Polysaccharide lyase-like protein n=1 Tax=Echinicola strongylocentroti TaxID=1795355 RepID=A0A2Z4IN33_9BACT|nr:polysaccharide lyase [Echinicola strongylocentroti]AWW32521.1 hypothetical protein DN752_21520 [Echinicola strongylocentroti]
MKSITTLPCKSFLAGLTTVFFVSSCQLDESQQLEVQESEEVAEVTTKLSGLLFSEDFEGDDPLRGVHYQGAEDYSLRVVSWRSFEGDKSAMFRLTSSDDMVANGTRSEILVNDKASSQDMWYSFAVYFPEDGYEYDKTNESISQWRQSSGGPSLSLRTAKDELYIRVVSPKDEDKWETINLGPIIKDEWTEFAFHVQHSSDSDGSVEVWRDGNKILNYKGPNLYKGRGLPHWKVGIYKSIWNYTKTDSDIRAIYMDNIRYGDQNVSLSDLVTGSILNLADVVINNPKEPKLIIANAHTESLWEDLHPGKIIYFSRLGTNKFSLYADVDERVESVRFDLYRETSNGYKLIHSLHDGGYPFLLFGDNGKGNFYYGNNFLESGRYKVEFAAFADEKGVIPIGDKTSSTFKIY